MIILDIQRSSKLGMSILSLSGLFRLDIDPPEALMRQWYFARLSLSFRYPHFALQFPLVRLGSSYLPMLYMAPRPGVFSGVFENATLLGNCLPQVGRVGEFCSVPSLLSVFKRWASVLLSLSIVYIWYFFRHMGMAPGVFLPVFEFYFVGVILPISPLLPHLFYRGSIFLSYTTAYIMHYRKSCACYNAILRRGN